MLFLLYESNVRIRVVPGMISGEWMSQYRIFGPGLKIIGCSSLFDGRTKVAVPDPDLIMINNKGRRKKVFFTGRTTESWRGKGRTIKKK